MGGEYVKRSENAQEGGIQVAVWQGVEGGVQLVSYPLFALHYCNTSQQYSFVKGHAQEGGIQVSVWQGVEGGVQWVTYPVFLHCTIAINLNNILFTIFW